MQYKKHNLSLQPKSEEITLKYKKMNETKPQKMNLEHERRIVALQERVERLENLCYSAKEVLNLEEASSFLGITKSTLYKLTGSNVSSMSFMGHVRR